MSDEDAEFQAMAHEIARMPEVAEKLRAAHVARPDGRCHGCPSTNSIAAYWPCMLRLLADRATELSGHPTAAP